MPIPGTRIRSHGGGRAEYHRALAGKDSSITVRQRHLAVLHLTLVAFAAHLAHRLDDHQQAVHARMAVREPAAAGVDRELAAGRDRAVHDEAAAFALGAETEVFEKQNG